MLKNNPPKARSRLRRVWEAMVSFNPAGMGCESVEQSPSRYVNALQLLDQAETLVPEAALAIGGAKSAVMEQLEAEDPEGALKIQREARLPLTMARPPLG